jgi:hypothetical protein
MALPQDWAGDKRNVIDKSAADLGTQAVDINEI